MKVERRRDAPGGASRELTSVFAVMILALDHADMAFTDCNMGSGLDVDVQFLPWKRAIAEAKNGEAVVYYPGYHCKHAADFEPSNPVGTGPLGKDDLTNLKKLLRRRIDAVVIDKLVMSYLVATEPSLSEGVDLLQFNETPLEDKTLHVCFTEDEVALRDRFNEGLEKVDSEKVVDDDFANEF